MFLKYLVQTWFQLWCCSRYFQSLRKTYFSCGASFYTGNWTTSCSMLNLYPGIYLVHKTQKLETYSLHKFILLKDFSKKNLSFFGPSGSFLLGAYVKSFFFGSPFFEQLSYAPILWIVLSFLFFLEHCGNCSWFFMKKLYSGYKFSIMHNARHSPISSVARYEPSYFIGISSTID